MKQHNKRGFTLAEEVVNILLISILVASASAIIINCMRMMSRNIISAAAQSRGIAVMNLLDDKLRYAYKIDTADLSKESKSTFSYVDKLYVDGGYVYDNVYRKNKDDGSLTDKGANKICKIGSYQIDYQVEIEDNSNVYKVTVIVKKSGNIYYSDYREITNKNGNSVKKITYSSSTDDGLYIASIE